MKKVKIIIILIAILLILGCASFAALYFTTDLFKPEREMFYKYISQMNFEEIFNTEANETYAKRLQNETYASDGSISLNIDQDGEKILQEKFNYNSQIDSANKLASSNVSINKDGNNVLTIDYLKNEDLYGVKFNEIVSQYIAFDNNNLKEFASKFGIEDISNIPDKIEIPETIQNIDQEEIKQLANKYLNLIIEQIPEESYSKVEKGNIKLGENSVEANGYKLTINTKTLQKIVLRLLNTLREDEKVFNLVNSLAKTVDSSQEIIFDEYQQAIDESIEEMSDEIETNSNLIDIIIYKQGKEPVKVYIKINADEETQSYMDFSIEKPNNSISIKANIIDNSTFGNQKTEFNITKNLDIAEKEEYRAEILMLQEEQKIGNINIVSARNGRLDSHNIQSTTTVDFALQGLSANLEYTNTVEFDTNINIKELAEGNHAVINELSAEQINNLITNLGNRITAKSGLNVIEIAGAIGTGMLSTTVVDQENTMVIGGGLALGISTAMVMPNALTNVEDFMNEEYQNPELEGVSEEQIKTLFNLQFSAYEGTQNGSQVRELIDTIIESNTNEIEHLVEYTSMNIETNKTYNVSFEKDEEGYINKVTIQEQ